MFAGWDEYHLINIAISGLIEDLPKSELGEVISHVLSSPGKRVRPLILIFSSRAFGGHDLGAVDAALAVELAHAASLVHDDILDSGIERRSAPSTLKMFGLDSALLAGDYLISKSIDLISSYPQKVIRVFSGACIRMSEGEMLDLSTASSPEDYYRCISLKTASLFAASAKIGCLIAGAPEEEVVTMERYGMHLGLAYQILDDLEEYLGIDQGKASNKASATLPKIYSSQHSARTALKMCLEAIGEHRQGAKKALEESFGDPMMRGRLAEIVDQMTLRGLEKCRLQGILC